MAYYRKIEPRIWTDRKFMSLSPMKPNGQGLFLLLLTAPQTGPIPGLFRASRAALADEFGCTVRRFDKVFKELEELGMAKADFTARLVWLPNALKHNKPESPNVVRSWVSAYEQLPQCGLLDEAIEAMRASVYDMGEGYKAAFDEAFGEQELPPETAPETAAPEPIFDEASIEPSGKPLVKPSAKPSDKPSAKTMPNQEQEQNEKEEAPSFFGGAVHPNGNETAARFKTLSAHWNALGIKPPFSETLVNLNRDEQEALIKALATYDDKTISGAMLNYQIVCNDPTGTTPAGAKDTASSAS